jgi:hypothetical protein
MIFVKIELIARKVKNTGTCVALKIPEKAKMTLSG